MQESQATRLVAILTSEDALATFPDKLFGHDVAIDFSVAEAVPVSVEACMQAGIPLVQEPRDGNPLRIRFGSSSKDKRGAGLRCNFSIGVNLFYRIVQHAAELFSAVEGYSAFIEEAPSCAQRDAPSGTAIRLQGSCPKAYRLRSQQRPPGRDGYRELSRRF
jgi:4-hydroxy-tetrahydrodipicolinate reductase